MGISETACEPGDGDPQVSGDNAGSGCPEDCPPDPGSRELSADECILAEEGIEFLPLGIWDFDPPAAEGEGIASNMYVIHDCSAESVPEAGSWEPYASEDPWHRCGRDSNLVFNVRGGPFEHWGGLVGRALKCLNGSPLVGEPKITTAPDGVPSRLDRTCGFAPLGACDLSQQDRLAQSVCPARDRQVLDGVDPIASDEEYLLGMTLDLSEWEGISLWARRSPASQATVHVALGDKHSSEDLSYLQYHITPDASRYCERNRQCGCSDNEPCTAVVRSAERINADGTLVPATKAYFCFDPEQPPKIECDPAVCSENPSECPCPPGTSCSVDPQNEPPVCRTASGSTAIECDWTVCNNVREDCSCSQIDDSWCARVVVAEEDVLEDGTVVPEQIRALCLRIDELLECGPSVCAAEYWPFQREDVAFQDPQSPDAYGVPVGKPCTAHEFADGTSGKFCFRPGLDPDPYESAKRCGHHGAKTLELSTDWQFFKIPFRELTRPDQDGQPALDLTTAYVVQISWDPGWIDLWIDDARFYRVTAP
jgi:hypothetical protein